MKKTMPKVLDCKVKSCSYWKDDLCHALAITVGDGTCPACDTYCNMSRKGGIPEAQGGVGACKVEACRFNEALECSAEGIHVVPHGDHAECSTYARR